jgi:hypothetical protein
MRKFFVVLAVATASVVTFGASAPAGLGPSEPASISVTEGVVGTTVTVTGTDCGQPLQGVRANGEVALPFDPGSGQLIVTVPGWPEPFASGFEGGTNDISGVATATFQVPDVPVGPYPITVECVSTETETAHAGLASEASPFAIGTYPGTLTFTVIAPAGQVPVVGSRASRARLRAVVAAWLRVPSARVVRCGTTRSSGCSAPRTAARVQALRRC